MIAEQLDFKVDIDALVNFYHTNIKDLLPYMQSKYFGGWSITSRNSHYSDGWQLGHAHMKTDSNGKKYFDKESARKVGVPLDDDVTYPTEIYRGPIIDVMNKIESLGLKPIRPRVSMLKPGGESSWHRDAPDDTYAVRLHIPIITNENCLFETEEGSMHLKADGSVYLLYVNKMHRIVNTSTVDRIHIMMKVTDDKQVSKYHRLEDFKP